MHKSGGVKHLFACKRFGNIAEASRVRKEDTLRHEYQYYNHMVVRHTMPSHTVYDSLC